MELTTNDEAKVRQIQMLARTFESEDRLALLAAFVADQELSKTQKQVVPNHIQDYRQDYRKRLCDLSWFTKCASTSP